GHREVPVVPRRLEGRQRHGLLLRDRAHPDTPRLVRAPPPPLVPRPREPRDPRLRDPRPVPELRATLGAPHRARRLHGLPDREHRHGELRLLQLPRARAQRLLARCQRRPSRPRRAAPTRAPPTPAARPGPERASSRASLTRARAPSRTAGLRRKDTG